MAMKDFEVEIFNCKNSEAFVLSFWLIALDPSKVESDPTGNKLVYGAEKTGMILRDSNQFLVDKGIIENNSNPIFIFDDLTISDACTFKFLPNGNLIYNDLATWDLVLLEQTAANNWTEKKRITGIG